MFHKQKLKGFTLLELLLVVFIIGSLAAVSLSFLDQEKSQERYTASIQRLSLISEAIVKVRDHDNQQVLSGFVYDNGTLPPIAGSNAPIQAQALIGLDTSWSSHSSNSYNPSWLTFSHQTPSYIANNSSIITLSSHKQFKGYRGPYLPASSLDRNTKFLDLWGLEYTLNQSSSDSLSFTFGHLLSNNSTRKILSLGSDITRTIHNYDWSVPLGQLTFTVINNSNSVITQGKKLSLIVFDNSLPLPWHTYNFTLDEIAVGETQALGHGQQIISSWSHNYYSSQNSNISVDSISASDVDSTRVAIGSHPVIIIDESNGNVLASTQILLMPYSSPTSIILKVS